VTPGGLVTALLLTLTEIIAITARLAVGLGVHCGRVRNCGKLWGPLRGLELGSSECHKWTAHGPFPFYLHSET
jgi:hypothetical protein